jgi:4-amino-4-deoxy-L-arabinose transferase-like glycosyltransferase
MSAVQLRRRMPTPRRRLAHAGAYARDTARRRPELLGLLALAAVLNLWGLDRNGFANDYYAAAVRSMSHSWHAFLYGSFDPRGIMTVDKPPLSSWVQVAFVKVFGFNSWSLLVPQALMGVATVGLVYDLARRVFGRPAGSVAGLVLALTPMTVAISRHNNPDALLVLCSVAAVWFLVRGLEDGRGRWLAWSGVAVGLGFEAKMAVALMVVPGIVAAWLWVAPRGLRRSAVQLAGFAGTALVVGLAWPVLMILTPAADRPWVSGTSDNSIWSLIFGYNGLGRLGGQAGGPQGMGGGAGGPGGGGGAGPFGGPAGPFRLLEQSLGGQAGWLLGSAIVAGLAVLVVTRLKRTDRRSGWVIAVGGAFLTCAVAFSAAKGIFHPYYVSLLAPFTALLVGAGAGLLTRGDRTMRVLAGAAVAAGVATELAVLHHLPGTLTGLRPLLVAAGVAALVLLVVADQPRMRTAVLGAVFALLLFAPASWAVQTLGHATQGTFPAGGPANAGGGFGGPGGGGAGGRGLRRFAGPGGFQPPQGLGGGQGFRPPGAGATGGAGPGGGGMFGRDSQGLTAAVRYAKAHGGGTVVTGSQSGASAAIIHSGADVAGIGGFSGRESQVTASWLAGAVRAGRIRWVLSDGGGFGGAGPGGNRRDGRVGDTKLMSQVAKSCRKIPVSALGGNSGNGSLYDCQGAATALARAGS